MNYVIMTFMLLTGFNLAAMNTNPEGQRPPQDCRPIRISRFLVLLPCDQRTNASARPKPAQETSSILDRLQKMHK
jgi:hypothetical protein